MKKKRLPNPIQTKIHKSADNYSVQLSIQNNNHDAYQSSYGWSYQLAFAVCVGKIQFKLT